MKVHYANHCRQEPYGKQWQTNAALSPSLASWLAGLLPAASSGQPGWCTSPTCSPPCLRSEPASHLATTTMPCPVQAVKANTVASSRNSVYLAVKHSHSCYVRTCQPTSPRTKALFNAQHRQLTGLQHQSNGQVTCLPCKFAPAIVDAMPSQTLLQ